MTETEKETIGIVGVGRMGLAIVGHLQRRGYRVAACDVNPAQREAAKREQIQD